jgi:hypothetical protein
MKLHAPRPLSLLAAAVLALASIASVVGAAGPAAAAGGKPRHARSHHAKRHARHGGRVHRRARRHARRSHPRPAVSTARVAPGCEDGTAAAATATGSACADGSEAACADGQIATLGPDGTVAYCTPEPTGETEAGEPACEASAGCPTEYSGEFDSSSCETGAPATLGEDGSFTCADGSEPGCPDGSVLTLGGGGTVLVCEAGTLSEEEG